MRFARRVSFRLSLQLSQQCSVLGLFAPRQSRVQIRTMRLQGLQPAARVSNQKKDVWSIVNEAAEAAEKPVINLGQGFFGYNPPEFVLNAAKESLDRVDCNQYSATQGRLRLRQALSNAYSPYFGRTLDATSEIVITSGANEGILSAIMGFVEYGDEVIVMEPYFDQYISNIEMAGGKVVYVSLQPPEKGDTETCPASQWTLDLSDLEQKITDKTRMIIVNSPHNPIGKIFSKDELQGIGDLCVKHDIIILSDEVYDRLYYTPFTRIATLSPEIDRRTITVGSAGKTFYCTGWRVGWLIGRPELVKYAGISHTRICFAAVSPLQEATAIGLELADAENFWETSKSDMKRKMTLFNEIWAELDLPFTEPDGGYFVLVNMKKVQIPTNYIFPAHIENKPRDFKLTWWLIKELGIAAIPPSEFYTEAHQAVAENYLRFAVCKPDEILEAAKQCLRALKRFM